MRPAMAARCTMPLVEPPMASSTRMAFSKAAGVRILSMVRRSRAMRTASVPVCSAMRMRSAVTAGGEAPPGTVMPSASAMQAMGHAARVVEVLHVVVARGLEVQQHGRVAAHAVQGLEVDVIAHAPRNGYD